MLEQDAFLEYYHLKDAFDNSGISWQTIQDIYLNYTNLYQEYLDGEMEILLKRLRTDKPKAVQSIYGRVKKPDHLIEKIIRKAGIENQHKYRGINVNNYREIVTDLIGIRILVLAREEWRPIDSHIRKVFHEKFEQPPIAYVCYGDREIIDEKILDLTYTNKGYRSQHYIVKVDSNIAEIQVRTLAEEVYGEFDHRARYPYHNDNKFLIRYSKIVSKSISELDDLISTCLELDDDLLESLDQRFKNDKYTDWSKKGEHSHNDIEQEGTIDYNTIQDVRDLVKCRIVRKED